MKKSMRRKIQNSMFLTSLISIVLMLVLMSLLLNFLYKPVATFITRNVASELKQHYDEMIGGSKNTAMKEVPKIPTREDLLNWINDLNATDGDHFTVAGIPELVLDEELLIRDQTEDINRLMFIIISSYDDSQSFLSFISENIPYYSVEFTSPEVSFYLGGVSDLIANMPFLEEDYNSSLQRLYLVSEDGNAIGKIEIRFNPAIYFALYAFLMVFSIIIALLSIVVTIIMSSFLSRSIIKPINRVNKQLKQFLEKDYNLIGDAHIQLKKPPKEIKALIDSSNLIMDEMRAVNQELEASNQELQAQNIVLLESEEIIRDQQNQLIQSEKMASIGQLSAAIVHEINTPVGAIKSNNQLSELLLEKLTSSSDPADQSKTIGKLKSSNAFISTAADRVIEIIKNLKNFSRIDQSEFKDSNIHDGLESVILLTSNLWKNKVTIERDYDQLPLIHCYPSLLNQVFMNIFVNAIDAINQEGIIKISTYLEEEHAVVTIADNGIGISPDHLGKIFHQGFTTKPPGKGSGLGLALCNDIMKKHNGYIEVESELGKGSTFTIKLPLCQETKSK